MEATASLAFSFDRPRPATVPRTKADLHICRCCHSDLVYPLDWAPLNGKRWTVDLRCPDCEWRGSGVFGQRVVDRFDLSLIHI